MKATCMKQTLSILLILSAGIAPAHAQTAAKPQTAVATTATLADTRFNSWLGCWRLEDDLAGTGARLCITPDGSGVRLNTIVGKINGAQPSELKVSVKMLKVPAAGLRVAKSTKSPCCAKL